MSRSVVITGLGSVSALGVGTGALWAGLSAGSSGLKPVSRFDASGFDCDLAGEVPNFSAKDFVPKHYRKAVKVMSRDIELAIGAAKEAVEDAGLVTRASLAEDSSDPTTYPSARIGCHIGAGLISADADELSMALAASSVGGEIDLAAWGKQGMENLTPLWMLKYLPNMVASHVTIIHGCAGPSNTITCAEASGLLSLGESMRAIERDACDACLSGGAESKLNLMGLLRTQFAHRLAHAKGERDGSKLVRPYDPASPGGVMGEAAGIVMLEERASASKRGAKVYAELAGYGAAHSPRRAILEGRANSGTCDRDEGLQFAIENALDDAGIKPEQIDACVLQGTGVPGLDVPEAGALRAIFGPRLKQIPIVTLGPSIGNTWAGAGGMLAVVASRCIKEQSIPARINHGQTPSDLDAGPSPARSAKLRYVLAAGGSLGGQNAAIVLKAL
jgi:3-oxoacyl-[acyl-carrier-protein] synthase II